MRNTVTEHVGYWIDDAITKHGQGETILWEHTLMPGPNMEPLYTVFVWFPGALIGSALNGSFQLVNVLSIEQQEIDDLIGEVLRQFREARSQQIASQTQQQPSTPPRGAQTPSGLLIP